MKFYCSLFRSFQDILPYKMKTNSTTNTLDRGKNRLHSQPCITSTLLVTFLYFRFPHSCILSFVLGRERVETVCHLTFSTMTLGCLFLERKRAKKNGCRSPKYIELCERKYSEHFFQKGSSHPTMNEA